MVYIRIGNMNNEIEIFTGLSLGERTRLVRLAKHLTQIQLAVMAHVQPCEITNLEKDSYVKPKRKARILEALGITDEAAND